MKVGTLPWLLQHELRLWWREMRSRPGVLIGTIILGILFAALFIPLWFALEEPREEVSSITIDPSVFWIAVFLWIAGFFYAFTQAMGHSLVALFEKGDLDLLVSSPVSSKVVFASRLLGVALKIFLTSCLFVVPASAIAVVFGFPELLGLYPALVGISLTCTSLAMLLIVWLVSAVGARKARTRAQVLTALISAVLFLSLQFPNFFSSGKDNEPIWNILESWFGQRSLLGEDSLIWLPARAIFFDPLAVTLTLTVSVGLTWLAVEILHHSFMTGTQQTLTRKQRQLNSEREIHFSNNFNQIVLLKEWRIIQRNPYLISRIFLQILFLIPALVVILRGESNRAIADFPTFVTVASIIIGGNLASNLTRICISGEEASELLISSPVNNASLRRLKLLAALIPVWILLSPLFIILILRGHAWFSNLVIFLGSTTTIAILSMWNSRPVPLTDIFKKRQTNTQADQFLGILQLICLLTWAWFGYSGLQGQFTPLIIIVFVLAIAYWRSRQIGTSLGF